MHGPEDVPTAADFAWDSAQESKSRISKLEERIAKLEKKLDEVISILASLPIGR